MAIKNFLSGGRELAQISKSRDVNDLKTWAASLFKRTIDSINQTNQAAVSSDEVTGSAAQVVATPAASSGTAAPTTLTTAYLANAPATADVIGAVKPDGTTITVSAGGVLSATAAAPPSGPGNQVFATPNGSAGDAEIRALVPADLPVATTSQPGAVQPDGTTITIAAGVISSVGGGGGYPTPTTVIASSAVSEIDITGAITSSYRDYDIRFSHLVLVTGSSAQLFIQFSTDNGVTWDTSSNYFYSRYSVQIANGGYSAFNESQNSGGLMITLLSSDTFNAGFIVEARMRLNFPMNSTDSVKMGDMSTQVFQNSSDVFQCEGGFWYSNSSGVNAVRLYSPTGTFTGQATIQPLPQ